MCKIGYIFFLLAAPFVFYSCGEVKHRQAESLVKEWAGKKVIFPKEAIFTIDGKDTIDFNYEKFKFKILTYVDTTGCTNCKLKLADWNLLIREFESYTKDVAFLFFIHAKNKRDLNNIIRYDKFHYPICLDWKDSLNSLNHFPSDTNFQTFLLDRENRIIGIGNPVNNPQIKKLYLKQLNEGKPNENTTYETTVSIDTHSLSMGTFNWQEEQKTCFRLRNTGGEPLVIMQVNTSCDCTTVDYSEEPVPPGKEAVLTVTYKADNPGYFERTVTVYCNTESSPVQLSISGDAQ